MNSNSISNKEIIHQVIIGRVEAMPEGPLTLIIVRHLIFHHPSRTKVVLGVERMGTMGLVG